MHRSPPSADDRLQRYVFLAFTALLVLLPVPFGGNRPWASDLFGVLCAVLLFATAFDLHRNPERWPDGAPMHPLRVSAVLLTGVVLWAVLQTQSWMPSAWHHPIWQSAKSLPQPFAGSISLEPDQSAESLVRLLSYVACFFLAFLGGRDNKLAYRFLKIFASAAVAYALYGLVMQATGLRKILWFDKWAYESFVTSTFVNKNSYATYAGLGLQACLALLWVKVKHRIEHKQPRRVFNAAWFEKMVADLGPYVLMCLVVLGALLLTGSRAGVVSALAGAMVMAVALAVNRRWKWRFGVFAVTIGLLLVFAFSSLNEMASLRQIDYRMADKDIPMRMAGYDIALRAIASNPWLGFGLGSFDSAFRIYRDPMLKEWFQHAHNDYIEMALELGIPAALMLMTAIGLMVAVCLRGARTRRRQETYPILALGASATVGLHACVDFSLHIPAVAAAFAAILGLGVAQSWSSRKQIA